MGEGRGEREKDWIESNDVSSRSFLRQRAAQFCTEFSCNKDARMGIKERQGKEERKREKEKEGDRKERKWNQRSKKLDGWLLTLTNTHREREREETREKEKKEERKKEKEQERKKETREKIGEAKKVVVRKELVLQQVYCDDGVDESEGESEGERLTEGGGKVTFGKLEYSKG